MQHISSLLQAELSAKRETTAKPVSDDTAAPPPAPWSPDLDAYEPSLVTAAELAVQFIADMAAGRPPYWITFSGVPGCGKTFLTRQIYHAAKAHNPAEQSGWTCGAWGFYDERIHRRPERVWLDASDFAGRLLRGDFDLPERLQRDYLVVLDDLGAARDKSEFIADNIYRLACRRLDRWTVWTTNFTAVEIAERIDPRLASRLIRDNNRAHRITADDYALRAKR